MVQRAIDHGVIRDRAVALVSLFVVAALAWLYLWREAAMMSGPGGMTMPMSDPWSATSLVLTFLMWSIMMVGMMLPSAAPAFLLYQTMVKKNAERGAALGALWVFVAGYLAAWVAFSLVATILQAVLQMTALLTPSMVVASTWLSGVILIAAGVYQWLPLKAACLDKCRNPLHFFLTRWRGGVTGAFRMGCEQGWYCVGCCWALMALLFVAGVMNLVWVALIAGFVFAEKVLPAGQLTARIAGICLVMSGLFLLIAG